MTPSEHQAESHRHQNFKVEQVHFMNLSRLIQDSVRSSFFPHRDEEIRPG
jgi:hypothetical protein